jgi:hypothetical protein
MRWKVTLAVLLGVLLLPAGAGAAQRYVTTAGSGSACTQPAPCSIEVGINAAATNDEVILAPGTYTTSTPLANSATSLSVHGPAGSPRPVIRTSAPTGLSLTGFSIAAHDLTIEHTGNQYGALLFSASATFDHLEVHSSSPFAACYIGVTVTFRDSLCVATGASAFAIWDDFTGPGSPSRFRNVTAIATGAGSIGLVVGSGQNTTNIVSAENMIIRGGSVDAQARNSGTGSTTIFGIDHSNFDSSNTVGDNSTVSGPGSASNQTADPAFAETVHYTQAYGSPTIDAGISDAYTGSSDLDGTPRPQGPAMDIGADEIVPDDDPPETTIVKGPRKRTRSTKARFEFEADEVGATFSCSLDGKPARPCTSPKKLQHLKRGRHRFAVAATDQAFNADATPATYRWKVKKRKR